MMLRRALIRHRSEVRRIPAIHPLRSRRYGVAVVRLRMMGVYASTGLGRVQEIQTDLMAPCTAVVICHDIPVHPI